MAELRWNPLLGTWVMVASHRSHRPTLDDDYCPFCPGSGRVPDDYEVHSYDNDYPSLQLEPPPPDVDGDELIPVRRAFGKCEVTLYSPRHDITLPELPLGNVERLVHHWTERYVELGSISGIEYVFIFENRGEAVGVTMIHPHGQIYAYPYIPLKMKVELASSAAHENRTGRCLFCDLLSHEIGEASRVVYRSEGFLGFVPPFAEFPYQVHLLPERHTGSLSDLEEGEKRALAKALKCVTGGYDDLFGYPFPYMMCMHQDPTDGNDYPHNHFHIEFYPVMRSRDQQKFNASSETGAWAVINPTRPEDKAAELLDKISKRVADMDLE